VINTFHIITFVHLIFYTELPGTFTNDTKINVANVTSGCQRLILCGVAL